ncbi:MAG TPA: beta-galactosidase [Terriglobales bacterium]|nr:beta-galactosidase [Terriglobales bacterium]
MFSGLTPADWGKGTIVHRAASFSRFLSGTSAQVAIAARALPLNRFEASRLSHPGPYRLAVGIADDYFDGTSSRDRVRRHFQIARQLGVKYLRCAFSWNAIEKSQGRYDWAFWDMLVAEAAHAHVQLIPYVAYTPKWAATREKEFWAQPPRDPELYAHFMRQMVERYRGKIHAWEIWNEPDNLEYWQGSVESYAELIRRAAMAMRGADPAAVLVLGGMSRGPGPFFRSLLEEYGLAGYVDVIAMHAYPESWDEERAETIYRDWAAQMANLIAREGQGDDFWINEMGYADYRFSPEQASRYSTSVFYDYEHTREYQADFLFKAEVMSAASPRVSLTAWYRIDDFSPAKEHFSDDLVNYHLGLIDATGKKKPVFYALKFFLRLFSRPVSLVDTPFEQRNKAASDSVVEVFRRTDGRIIVTGWLRSSLPSEVARHSGMLQDKRHEKVSVTLPCKSIQHPHLYDVEGREVTGHAIFQNGRLKNVPLTGNKVFIEEMQCQD